VPELLRRAVEKGLLVREDEVDRVSAYRALRRFGVPLCRTASKRETDMRRFAYAHRMQMLLVDGKHFRAGASRLRRVVFFFIDDCSRFVLGAVVGEGSGESPAVFLRGLFDVICRFGLIDVIFFDSGSAFIADAAHAVLARLGIRYVHGTKGYPEGRAKVERFNRTAWTDVLRALRRPEVDPAARSLEFRIRHYLDTQYNERPHEGIGKLTPRAKWDADERDLRFPASVEELRSKFFIAEARKVSLDNVLKMDSIAYEVPRGHADTSIEVRRHLLDDRVCILHQGRIVQLHPVDLARNAEARRAAPRTGPPEDDDAEAPLTAASLAFERDFGPVLPVAEKPAHPAHRRGQHKE
jgi:transposase InsO family protein